MKHLLIIALTISFMNVNAQQEESFFIHAVAPKVKGQYDFILIELVNDSTANKTYYRFIFKKKSFTVAKKNIYPNLHDYAKRLDGNVFEGQISDGRETIFYTSTDFKNQMQK
jgi:hypothetical protein